MRDELVVDHSNGVQKWSSRFPDSHGRTSKMEQDNNALDNKIFAVFFQIRVVACTSPVSSTTTAVVGTASKSSRSMSMLKLVALLSVAASSL